MGIRDVAAAAKIADEAAKKAEQARLWEVNARAGEATVRQLLGVEGKALRARNDKEHPHGKGSVLQLEDDLFVKVVTKDIYGPTDPWTRVRPLIEERPALVFCGQDGRSITRYHRTVSGGAGAWSSNDHPFKSMAELAEALEQHDSRFATREEVQ